MILLGPPAKQNSSVFVQVLALIFGTQIYFIFADLDPKGLFGSERGTLNFDNLLFVFSFRGSKKMRKSSPKRGDLGEWIYAMFDVELNSLGGISRSFRGPDVVILTFVGIFVLKT